MQVLRLACASLALAAACASGTASAGPLTLDVPDGWRVTRRNADSLQLADGSAGGGTEREAGSATAVFDVYLDAAQGIDEFRAILRAQNTAATEERFEVDGYEAVAMSYGGPSFAGRQEAVFIPDRGVRIVYRAAFPNDDAAYFAGRSKFRAAVESIRLEAEPGPD